MNHSRKMTHEQIEKRVDGKVEEFGHEVRMEVFGEVMKEAGVYVRMHANGHHDIYKATTLLQNQVCHTGQEAQVALLSLTVAELISLRVDAQPGEMDYGKFYGLVPLDSRNKRDGQYGQRVRVLRQIDDLLNAAGLPDDVLSRIGEIIDEVR